MVYVILIVVLGVGAAVWIERLLKSPEEKLRDAEEKLADAEGRLSIYELNYGDRHDAADYAGRVGKFRVRVESLKEEIKNKKG